MSLWGAFNRVLRRWGRGTPLYFIQSNIVYFGGKDKKDRDLFDVWLGVNTPHLVVIHDIDGLVSTGEVIDWMRQHAGIRAVHINPREKEYVCGFANPNDAFAAKMYFPRVTLMGP